MIPTVYVKCWRVDKDLIFFGPCSGFERSSDRSFWRVAVTARFPMTCTSSASMPATRKKSEGRGRKTFHVMTFWEADKRLNGDRFRKLRDHKSTPLHVLPLLEDGQLVGFTNMWAKKSTRKDQKWVGDLASHEDNVRLAEERLELGAGVSAWDGFDRDCCLLWRTCSSLRAASSSTKNRWRSWTRSSQKNRMRSTNTRSFGRG